MTYNDYLIKITETIKIRATNFRLSQNDIIYMANNVFVEIASMVNLDPMKQDITIVKDINDYDLNALHVVVDNTILLDCYKIRDNNGIPMEKFFAEIDKDTFQIKYNTEDFFHREYDDRIISFFRETIPDIEQIDLRMQLLIFEAIINGIMYYTQIALPNNVTSESPMNQSSQFYNAYMKSVEKLIEKFPQR